MRLPGWVVTWIWNLLWPKRSADLAIGGWADPYLLRWYLLPRNRLLNVYLHCFKRSDDDRALHDHPWVSVSLLLEGSYVEHTIACGGVHRRRRFARGSVRWRGARFAHRIEHMGEDAWTLFITGPVVRRWGFHCPRGWVPWQVLGEKDGDGASVNVRRCEDV